MNNNTAASPLDTSPSLQRDLSEQEILLRQLLKKVEKHKKAINNERLKISAYKSQVQEKQAESRRRLSEKIIQGRETFQKFLLLAVDACKSKQVRRAEKYQLRDLILSACEFLGTEEPEIPDWMYCDPPEPSNPKKTGLNDTFPEEEESSIFESAEHSDFEDYFRMERELWEGERIDLSEIERKSLRRIYLRVANLIHPDRTQNLAQQQKMTALMQEVNSAYRRGDAEFLLKIEREVGESIVSDIGRPLTSFEQTIALELERVESEEQALSQQLRRVRRELRELKHSTLGQLERERSELEKLTGVSPDDLFAEQLDQTFQQMATVNQEIEAVLLKRINGKTFAENLDRIFSAPTGPEELLSSLEIDDLDFGADFDHIVDILLSEQPRTKVKKRKRR